MYSEQNYNMSNELCNLSFTKIMFPIILGRFVEDHLNCTVGKQAVDGAESAVKLSEHNIFN